GESPPAEPSIREWVVDRSNLDGYMKRVRSLLREQADGALKESRIPKDYNDLYHDIVLAAAWQESCFRQFREKKGKIRYLRSYNGTSVGIMQVNERVWRGLYEGNRLRWDITYNAMAGCRILELYLFKYILNRLDRIEKEIALDDDLVARMVYAVYNGGPSQVKKFAGRVKSGKFYNADTLFNEKYEWVKKGDWDKIRKCLIGG
ncbi:MAG TPA: lytic transglycosylase domain-containing protein, partial [Syntrophales bacterium]|nr:lytic transglycosylase domain-containing protein [Syntrophales bacterium]